MCVLELFSFRQGRSNGAEQVVHPADAVSLPFPRVLSAPPITRLVNDVPSFIIVPPFVFVVANV